MVKSRLKWQVQSTVSSSVLFSLLVSDLIITVSYDMNCKGQCMWNKRPNIQCFPSNRVAIKSKCIHSSVKESLSVVSYCDPMDYTVHGVSRPENWSGYPFPSPGNLPNPGIKPRPPTLPGRQTGKCFSPEPQGKIPQFQFRNYVQIIRV